MAMQDNWQFVSLKDRFNAAALSVGTAAVSAAPLLVDFKTGTLGVAAGIGLLGALALHNRTPSQGRLDRRLAEGDYFPLSPRLQTMTDDLRDAAGLKTLRGFIGTDDYILGPGGDRRLAHAAAYSLPHSNVVVIGQTMERHYTDDELRFILAHETGHVRARDGRGFSDLLNSASRLGFLSLAALACGAQILSNMGGPHLTGTILRHGTLMDAFPAMLASYYIRTAGTAFLSRMKEYRTDANALYLTRNFAAAVGTMGKLYAHASKMSAWTNIFGTHPTHGRRVKNLEKAWEKIRLLPPPAP
jgi:Zn-dependent protease with chaperone function